MFASGTGSMRGPRVKTPLLLLLLLLLLLTTLTRTVTCQDDGDVEETPEEDPAEPEPEYGDINISETPPTVSDATSTTGPPLPEEEVENFTEEDVGSGLSRSNPVDGTSVDPDVTGPTNEPVEEEEEGLNPIIIMIPVVLVVVIIGMIVCGIFLNRRCNQKVRNQELRKEDPYLDGSSTEKVPMPMFEEDVPSVLELEMEELDQWMRKDVEPAEDSKNA